MKKRITALIIVFTMMIVFVMPTLSEAARWNWKITFVAIRSDVDGTVYGYVGRDDMEDIMGDATKDSVWAAINNDLDADKPYKPDPLAEESFGLHHNLALNKIIGNQKLSELTEDIINERLEKYLIENNFTKSSSAARDEEVGITKVRRLSPNDKIIKRIDVAFEILEELEDPIREGEDPTDVKMKAVTYLRDGIREEVRKDLEELPFRKLQEIINKENEKQLKDGEEPIYLINGKKVIQDDIAYLLAASVLEFSFDFWAGDHIDKGEDEVKDEVEDEDEEMPPTEEFIFQLTLKIGEKIAKAGEKEILLDAAPFIENDRTMVPLRFIGEQLGAEISWDGAERKVGYTLGDKVVELWIDNNMASVNGIKMMVDDKDSLVVPIIKNDRTFVPVRFIVEALGFEIEWDEENQEVMVQDYNSSRSNKPRPIIDLDTGDEEEDKVEEPEKEEAQNKIK